MFTIKNLSVEIETIPIISNVTLSLQPGSVHVLMGPNGSGKSSLAHALMGDPHFVITEGSVHVDDQELTNVSPDKRAQAGLFLAFQYPYELPGVPLFTFLKEAYCLVKKQIISVSDFQRLLFLAMDVLHIDRSFVERNVNEGFSGGEKKRFEMLQILLLQPKVAILDEIDSGLDVDALQCVAQGISYARQQNPNLIVLLITHYQRLLQYVVPDYVHVMQQGVITESGDKSLALKIDQEGYAEKRI